MKTAARPLPALVWSEMAGLAANGQQCKRVLATFGVGVDVEAGQGAGDESGSAEGAVGEAARPPAVTLSPHAHVRPSAHTTQYKRGGDVAAGRREGSREKWAVAVDDTRHGKRWLPLRARAAPGNWETLNLHPCPFVDQNVDGHHWKHWARLLRRSDERMANRMSEYARQYR